MPSATSPAQTSGPWPLSFEPGQTVAQAVYLSGLVEPPSLCSGLGQCGKCRMRLYHSEEPQMLATEAVAEGSFPVTCLRFATILPEDRALLSEADLTAGYRLACHHRAEKGLVAILPPGSCSLTGLPAPVLPPSGVSPSENAALAEPFIREGVLAVDLGTTSVQWVLLAHQATTGGAEQVDAGSLVNPQAGAGSDVVSRLAFAAKPQGARTLTRLTRAMLARLVEKARQCGVRVRAIVLAANPAMTALTLGLDTRSLGVAPYSLPFAGGMKTEIDTLPPILLPAPVSPFVGGDISAGYAAILADCRAPFPFLLADLGTNGEFVLAVNAHEAYAASVALGPALEGIGLTFGTGAAEGAITGYALAPHGLAPQWFSSPKLVQEDIASKGATGMSGTGYLSLLGILRKTGIMQADGQLARGPHMLAKAQERYLGELTNTISGAGGATLAGKMLRPLPLPSTPFFALPHGMYLSARDVEELLKVKAAFSMGLECLLERAGLAWADLNTVCLAGAMGTHVDMQALCTLGFLPDDLTTASKVKAVGNTALKGAMLLAEEVLSQGTGRLEAMLANWAVTVKSVNLAEDAAFQTGFIRHMVFGTPK